jgi:hypothetical protein
LTTPGFPESHPLYLWILAVWVFAFGLCYFWMAWTGRRERLFIAFGAIGKLSFLRCWRFSVSPEKSLPKPCAAAAAI